MFGMPREKESVESDLQKLEIHYKRYKQLRSKNALLRGVIRAFTRDLCLQFFMGTTTAAFQFASPYIIYRLINFIKDSGDNPGLEWDKISEGVYLCIALLLTQIMAYMVNEHMYYRQIMTGIRSSNAVVAMIYKKHARISSATNKQFNSGKIVNFIQVDARRLFWVSYKISNVTQIPFVFGLAITLCFI